MREEEIVPVLEEGEDGKGADDGARHRDHNIDDLLEVRGPVHLGRFEEILGQVLDEVAQDKKVEDLTAGNADDDEGPEGVEQAEAL